MDALSFYRRRPDQETEVVEFDEWISAKTWKKEAVEEQISFQIDFKDWQQTLTKQEKTILSHLMQGLNAIDIAKILQLSYSNISQVIKQLKQKFLEYFSLAEYALP